MSENEAIAFLLECGASVEKGGWHIYRSDSTGEYVLLNLHSQSADLDEESYPDIGDAVAKFIRRSKL